LHETEFRVRWRMLWVPQGLCYITHTSCGPGTAQYPPRLSSWFDLIYALLNAKRAGKWLNIYGKHYRNILLARQTDRHICVHIYIPVAAVLCSFNLPSRRGKGEKPFQWVVVGGCIGKRLSQGRRKNRDTRKVGGKWLWWS